MVIHQFSFGLLQEPIVLGQYSSSADFIARRKYSSHAALEVLLLSMESQHEDTGNNFKNCLSFTFNTFLMYINNYRIQFINAPGSFSK